MSTTIGVLDLVTGAFGAGVVGAFANQAPGLDQGLVARRSDLEVAAPTCGTGPGRGTRALRVGLRARGGGHSARPRRNRPVPQPELRAGRGAQPGAARLEHCRRAAPPARFAGGDIEYRYLRVGFSHLPAERRDPALAAGPSTS